MDLPESAIAGKGPAIPLPASPHMSGAHIALNPSARRLRYPLLQVLTYVLLAARFGMLFIDEPRTGGHAPLVGLHISIELHVLDSPGNVVVEMSRPVHPWWCLCVKFESVRVIHRQPSAIHIPDYSRFYTECKNSQNS